MNKKKVKKVPFSRLTAKQAKSWLINNDPEGADIWKEISGKKELIESVSDNLSSYGIDEQGGHILITSNQECFQNSFVTQRNRY
ncbi:hypothetical protein L1267_19150 [Pseudoalteromonas sp. OFAV1]|uniref:hypothetical protein n=1 Tax=Pseudoalteromonas sp. OFAV1 TaxID=2908892 RepID=UPI001F322D9B|nr:hypothetical protein [Pseudoalteromonas sp. OFAV1]MCF2902492.1 hypothetical protein [Pseudoalteromonas sp. OFAV1]